MPTKNAWVNGKEALEDALRLENNVNDYIYKIHGISEHLCQDPHVKQTQNMLIN